MYYRIYSAIRSQITGENKYRTEEFEEKIEDGDCPDDEQVLTISYFWDESDFISEVVSDDICYCPCICCRIEQNLFDDEFNGLHCNRFYKVDIQILITNGAVRCYLYYNDGDDTAFIKKLQYQLNLEVISRGEDDVVFKSRNEDYWILDNLKGLDEETFSDRINDITSKIFVIGEQLYEFAKKGGYFE